VCWFIRSNFIYVLPIDVVLVASSPIYHEPDRHILYINKGETPGNETGHADVAAEHVVAEDLNRRAERASDAGQGHVAGGQRGGDHHAALVGQQHGGEQAAAAVANDAQADHEGGVAVCPHVGPHGNAGGGDDRPSSAPAPALHLLAGQFK